MKLLLVPLLLLFQCLMPIRAEALAPVPAVQWSQVPLLKEASLYPGDRRQVVVTVFNSDSLTHAAFLEINDVKDGGLLSAIELAAGSNILSTTETNRLGDIGPRGTLKIPLSLMFKGESGNQYEGKSLSFFVCIRFEEGEKVCTPNNLVAGDSDQSVPTHIESSISSGRSQANGAKNAVQAVSRTTPNIKVDAKESLTQTNQALRTGERWPEVDSQTKILGREDAQVQGEYNQKIDIGNSEELASVGRLPFDVGITTASVCLLMFIMRLVIA